MMKSISCGTGLFAVLILLSLSKPAATGEPGQNLAPAVRNELRADQTLLAVADARKDLEPALVNPGPTGGPPSDAIILFDGHDLSEMEDP